MVNWHYILWSGTDPTTIDKGPPLGLAGLAISLTPIFRSRTRIPFNERLLTARFNHRRDKLSVIVAYALTNLASDIVKYSFYNILSSLVERIFRHDMNIILTDANAIISPPVRVLHPDGVESFFVDPNTNDNGESLLNLCLEPNLKKMDICFLRRRTHFWT